MRSTSLALAMKTPFMKSLTVLAISLCSVLVARAASPVVALPLIVGTNLLCSTRLLPDSAQKGFIVGCLEALKSLEAKGLLPNLGQCEVSLAPGYRTFLTSQSPPARSFMEGLQEQLEKGVAVAIWLERPQEFAAAFAAQRSLGGSSTPPRRPGNTKTEDSRQATKACECEGEVCLSSDGAMTFSLTCDDIGVSVGSAGDVSLEVSVGGGKKVTIPVTRK